LKLVVYITRKQLVKGTQYLLYAEEWTKK